MTLRKKQRGFTLIELLTVIAIIAILAGILIPTVSSVRVSAKKAETKVRFNQWALAMEQFKQEYGYYPVLDSSNVVNPPGQSTTASTVHLFHDILAGRRRNGDALPAVTNSSAYTTPESQNKKRIAFYSFSDSEFASTESSVPNLLVDAFGNTEIAVLVDKNGDGTIKVSGSNADYTSLPLVNGYSPTIGAATPDFPATGVRAGVVFYSAGNGTSVDDLIFSWK